jgi:hypothetical protein
MRLARSLLADPYRDRLLVSAAGRALAFDRELRPLPLKLTESDGKSSKSWLSAFGGQFVGCEPDGSILASGKRPDRDTYTASADPGLKPVTALRLEVLRDEKLPKNGPGRQDNGNLHLSEFEAYYFQPGKGLGQKLKFKKASADFNQESWTIQHALDGNPATAWGIHPEEGKPHTAVFVLAAPALLAGLGLISPSTLLMIGVGLALVAHDAALLVLGAQWLPAVPVMQILAVAAAFSAITLPLGSVLGATGDPRIVLFLHATRTRLAHPVTSELLDLHAPLPRDCDDFVKALADAATL